MRDRDLPPDRHADLWIILLLVHDVCRRLIDHHRMTYLEAIDSLDHPHSWRLRQLCEDSHPHHEAWQQRILEMASPSSPPAIQTVPRPVPFQPCCGDGQPYLGLGDP